MAQGWQEGWPREEAAPILAPSLCPLGHTQPKAQKPQAALEAVGDLLRRYENAHWRKDGDG